MSRHDHGNTDGETASAERPTDVVGVYRPAERRLVREREAPVGQAPAGPRPARPYHEDAAVDAHADVGGVDAGEVHPEGDRRRGRPAYDVLMVHRHIDRAWRPRGWRHA